MSETYPNKTLHTIVEILLVIKQDTTVVNKRQQSIFIFRYDGFNASEVYCVKQWENFAWADVSRLWYIVMYSDVISFLTDMRKSRWIPTLMNRSLGKTLINTALILDW